MYIRKDALAKLSDGKTVKSITDQDRIDSKLVNSRGIRAASQPLHHLFDIVGITLNYRFNLSVTDVPDIAFQRWELLRVVHRQIAEAHAGDTAFNYDMKRFFHIPKPAIIGFSLVGKYS